MKELKKSKEKKFNFKDLNLPILIIPFIIIALISLVLFFNQSEAAKTLKFLNIFFGDKTALIYQFVCVACFILLFALGFSKYGNIVLGKKGEKPKFSFFSWGAMMFCCGVSGSLPYWGFTEWLLYSNEKYVQNLGNAYDFANVYSFFFWSNYWYYLVLGVCFGFMLHVRLKNKQRYSEAMRPLFGKLADGVVGKIVDVFATLAIIAAVTCSLSVSTPIITSCLHSLCNIPNNNITTIVVLIITCMIYSISLANGLKGIDMLSRICVYVFLGMIIYILLFGGQTQFILESTFKQIGLLVDKAVVLFTNIDPTRKDYFVIDYCVFYNSYWLAWAIAVPFFIGVISKGRTIREVLIGGMLFAAPGTILCFSVLANYAEALQIFNIVDLNSIYKETGDVYSVINTIIQTLPLNKLFMVILVITMMCLNATSFDSISLTCSYYSYKNITNLETPSRWIKQYWAIILIILPLALIFSEETINNLTTIVVIFGFPGAILLILVVLSFFKDANKYLKGEK